MRIAIVSKPNKDYTVACGHCGTTINLQLVPHRNDKGFIVGWIFSCEKCADNMLGKHVYVTDNEFADLDRNKYFS